MKKIVIITLLSYLSYSTLPAFAAAPPAAGDGSSIEAGKEQRPLPVLAETAPQQGLRAWFSDKMQGLFKREAKPSVAPPAASSSAAQGPALSPETEETLDTLWHLRHHKDLQDALVQELAENYQRTTFNQRPSREELQTYFAEKGYALPPGIMQLVHRKLHSNNPTPIMIDAKFNGNFDKYSKKLLHDVQLELQNAVKKMGEGCYVLVPLNNANLGSLQPELLSQLIQKLFRVFASMGCHIHTLVLASNKLATLPDGMFDGMDELLELDLSYNQLTTLQPGIFDGLYNLHKLNLAANELRELQPGTFAGLQSLQELLLKVNKLTTLQPGAFNGLEHLEGLILSQNKLTTMVPHIFDGLHNLLWIELVDNPIASDAPAIQRLRQQLPPTCVIKTTLK